MIVERFVVAAELPIKISMMIYAVGGACAFLTCLAAFMVR
jgi:hypothetical protein